jgi:hypothetical protein
MTSRKKQEKASVEIMDTLINPLLKDTWRKALATRERETASHPSLS